jgi:hypothetical protein
MNRMAEKAVKDEVIVRLGLGSVRVGSVEVDDGLRGLGRGRRGVGLRLGFSGRGRG